LNLYLRFSLGSFYTVSQFGSKRKHCNLIYVDSSNELLFKIVIQPNYSSKLGNINTIVTVGIVYEDTLKSKYYEEIQNMDGN